MATRTVRLDDEAERTLQEVREATGLPISEAFKRGLHALLEQVRRDTPARTPYEVFRELDLGPGGYAIAPARDAKKAVREAIQRKHHR